MITKLFSRFGSSYLWVLEKKNGDFPQLNWFLMVFKSVNLYGVFEHIYFTYLPVFAIVCIVPNIKISVNNII